MDRTIQKTADLISPYGGRLVNLLVEGTERTELLEFANTLPSIQLTPRSLCDIELLAVGAFSPLDRFMGKADYTRVIEEMRLSNGTLFPIPITLPLVDPAPISRGQSISLRSSKNELIAVMKIEEIFAWDLEREAGLVYGTTDSRHPMVAEMASWEQFYIS